MRIDPRLSLASSEDRLKTAIQECSCQSSSLPTSKAGATALRQIEGKTLSTQEKFLRQYAAYAIHTQRLTGIPASVTLAQAALESGWGKHAPGNNFFGIKGTGPAGSQSLWTHEYRNGQMQRVRAKFRRYETPLQSFVDHAQVISRGKYLKHAMNHTGSAKEFITALQSGKQKYATDPRYAEKTLKLIERYQLEKLDIGGLP